jgi:5-methylcytosine-specific restriction endonuclease McrA
MNISSSWRRFDARADRTLHVTATVDGSPCRKCGRTTRYVSSGKCVVCRTARNRLWRKQKRAADPEWAERERRRNREWWSQVDAEWKLRRRESKRKREAIYFRERYASDEDFKERARSRWRKRRALKKGSRSEPYTRDQAYAQTGGRCTRCGRLVRKDTGWHIDHRVPLSKGGADVLINVGPSHAKCNLRGHVAIAKMQESLFPIRA